MILLPSPRSSPKASWLAFWTEGHCRTLELRAETGRRKLETVVMIIRIWRGSTRLRDKDSYREYLNRTGMKDYLACRGNRGATLLCRELPEEQRAEFLFISYWQSLDAIKEFAGAEIDTAHYYPEDKKFLLGLEPKVTHYEVLSDSKK